MKKSHRIPKQPRLSWVRWTQEGGAQRPNSGIFRLFGYTTVIWTLATVSCLLTGCSSYQDHFECDAGKGLGCKSVSQVNAITEAGDLGLGVSGQPMTVAPAVASTSFPAGNLSLDEANSIHRVSEERVKVWIAPFQDDQGNFHEASVIHTVVRPGYWQISDMAALSPEFRSLTPGVL